MGTIGLGFRNRAVAGVTVSGGSWVASLPASNVLTTDRAEVARSTDATTGSTQFDIDFGTARALRAFALQAHNLSQAASWRITLGTTPGGTDVHNGSSQAAWFLPFTGPEEWEDAAWWGLPQDAYTGHPHLAPILLPATLNARYLRVLVTDTANAAGYVQIGRLWAGELWLPQVNAAFPMQHGHQDFSAKERTRGGGVVADKQRRARTVRLSLDALSATEAAWVHEINRRAGTVEELLFLPDVADYQECQRYGFIGTAEQLSPMARTNFERHSQEYDLTEWI